MKGYCNHLFILLGASRTSFLPLPTPFNTDGEMFITATTRVVGISDMCIHSWHPDTSSQSVRDVVVCVSLRAQVV